MKKNVRNSFYLYFYIFKEHFEKLALGNERGDVSDTNGELSNIPPNEILNRPFTPKKIMEALAKLKNNKSRGSDENNKRISETFTPRIRSILHKNI